jgi:hypothetical protein
MIRQDWTKKLLAEYFYAQICHVENLQDETITAMRTKKGLVILSDKLRALEIEKKVLMQVWSDLQPFDI